jgi:hypothetical protein
VSGTAAAWPGWLRETGDVIDLDYPLFLVDRVEDTVPAGLQAAWSGDP